MRSIAHISRLIYYVTFAILIRESTIIAAEVPLDLNQTWIETPWNKPVIDRGPAGAWDHYAVDNPYIHLEEDVYYCFYEGQDVPFHNGAGHERIGLATSRDGVNWTKHAGNPILDVGPPGAWDHMSAKLPGGVIRHEGRYYLFFSGRNGDTKKLGVATADKLTGPWRKRDRPILSGRTDAWDRQLSTYPAPVFRRDGQIWLLYRGMQSFYKEQGVGMATSRNLLDWQRAEATAGKPIIAPREEIASFAVTEHDGRYVAIPQTAEGAKRHYFRSRDLIHWDRGPEVRIKASVAVETASNPFLVGGTWCILYEQKDRIYRAVLSKAGPMNESK